MTEISGPVGRLLRRHDAEFRAVLERHGARRPRIFGSVARGEDTEESDIDLVVDMPAGASLTDVAGLMLDLRVLFGRRVDVFTTGAIDETISIEAVEL